MTTDIKTDDEPLYNIWSCEHNGWWGVHRQGYVKSRVMAGAYSYCEAFEIVLDANRFQKDDEVPNETMVPAIDT